MSDGRPPRPPTRPDEPAASGAPTKPAAPASSPVDTSAADLELLLGRGLTGKLGDAIRNVTVATKGAQGTDERTAATPPVPAGATSVTDAAPPKAPPLRLEDLVGQAAAKTALEQVIAVARMSALRKSRQMPGLSITLHAVFEGSPGTGKTTFARFYAQEVSGLGLLSKGHLVEVARQDLVAEYQGQTAGKTAAVIAKAKGGVLFIDEAYALKQSKDDAFGQEAIDTLVKCMEDLRDDLVVIFAGYTEEMRRFLHHNTGIKSRVPNVITFADYTLPELREILGKMAAKQGFALEPVAVDALMSELSGLRRGRSFGNAREVRNLLERAMAQQSVRLARRAASDPASLTNEDLTTLRYSDVTAAPDDHDAAPATTAPPGAWEALLALPGLAGPKADLRRLVDLLKVSRLRRGEADDRLPAAHMLFVGPAGSGRATVARRLGAVLREAGLLAGGQVVEAERGALVAEYQGQTAARTRARIDDALGGVLVLRGVSALLRDSYGREALDQVAAAMAGDAARLVVVVRCDAVEAAALREVRPEFGAARALEFKPYTDEELAAIVARAAGEQGFVLDEAARSALARAVVPARSGADGEWGATEALGLLDEAVRRHAARIAARGPGDAAATRAELDTLTALDFGG